MHWWTGVWVLKDHYKEGTRWPGEGATGGR